LELCDRADRQRLVGRLGSGRSGNDFQRLWWNVPAKQAESRRRQAGMERTASGERSPASKVHEPHPETVTVAIAQGRYAGQIAAEQVRRHGIAARSDLESDVVLDHEPRPPPLSEIQRQPCRLGVWIDPVRGDWPNRSRRNEQLVARSEP